MSLKKVGHGAVGPLRSTDKQTIGKLLITSILVCVCGETNLEYLQKSRETFTLGDHFFLAKTSELDVSLLRSSLAQRSLQITV